MTIKRLSYSNSVHKKQLQKLRDTCIDEWFAAGYECTRFISGEPGYELHQGRPDFMYVALDEDQRVVGFLETSYIKNLENKVDAMSLRLLSARAGEGIGTKLVRRLIDDAESDRRHNIQFIIVQWGGGTAFQFYLKKGFLQYGATPAAVYKIKTIPDINRMRFLDLSNSYDLRLHFSRKEDNMERWIKEYASLSEARDITEFPELNKRDVILADTNQLQQT